MAGSLRLYLDLKTLMVAPVDSITLEDLKLREEEVNEQWSLLHFAKEFVRFIMLQQQLTRSQCAVLELNNRNL